MFKSITSLEDKYLFSSSQLNIRQDLTDTKSQIIESILSAVVSSDIAAEEVSHIVTNFILDLQNEARKKDVVSPSSSGTSSFCTFSSTSSRETKAKVFA